MTRPTASSPSGGGYAAEYDYPTFHLSMRCYTCKLEGDAFELLEHHAAKWLDISRLD